MRPSSNYAPIQPDTRAVFFDAVGTLIEPEPSAVEVYHAVGQRFGCDLDREIVRRRFHEVFQTEESADAELDWVVSEAGELDRWQRIVAWVFQGQRRVKAIFRELWDHFARPESWRVADHAGAVLRELAGRGLILGIGSNFDRRLHAIADHLPGLAPIRHRVISSEVGWRKPSPHFFAAITGAAGCEPGEIAFVGDRRNMDHDGANAAGLRGVLLDPQASAFAGVRRIRCLTEL